MDLSIIIPTKNEEKNLPRLLKSLSGSSSPWEIVIVDNFSSDKTQEVAENFKKKLEDKIKLRFFQQGQERSAQKNLGAQKARNDYLLFLDADMQVPKPLLSEIQNLCKNKKKAAIIFENSKGRDFWGQAVALERNCYQGIRELEAPRFFSKKLFNQIGGFDPELIAGEDWDLKSRLEKKGITFSKTQNHLIHHEAQGFIANLKRKWYYTEHIRFYAKKHPHAFSRQSGISNRIRILWRSRFRLIRKPLHTLAFFLLKFIIFIKWMVAENLLKYETKSKKEI